MSEYGREYNDQINCAKCNILAEESLLLTCEHNLCLPCASQNLLREETKGIHKYQVNI